jgi:hypothetical protein
MGHACPSWMKIVFLKITWNVEKKKSQPSCENDRLFSNNCKNNQS